jgi:mRNA (guanine-N7-)-methyltransferase
VAPPPPVRTRYAAKRVTAPGIVRVPLSRDELARFATLGTNPLRAAWKSANPGRGDGWQEMFARFGIEGPSTAPPGSAAPAAVRAGPEKVLRGKASLPPNPMATAAAAAAAAAVASHYNSRPDAGLEARNESPILPLRKFNNWVKSAIISQFGRRGGRVLDLGAGKGGDLRKWAAANVRELVLVGEWLLRGDAVTSWVLTRTHRHCGSVNRAGACSLQREAAAVRGVLLRLRCLRCK